MCKVYCLLPPYLNAIGKDGKRSKGPAVVILQLLMLAIIGMTHPSRWRVLHHVRLTGFYDEVLIEAVKEIQRELNSAIRSLQLEVDGNFGPATRAAILTHYDMDLNTLLTGRTEYIDADGESRIWPPEQLAA